MTVHVHNKLINQFAVCEEEVWRATLEWAKRCAGVNKPTSQWSEKDRQRIMQVDRWEAQSSQILIL